MKHNQISESLIGSFNSNGDEYVEKIKEKAKEMIDLIDDLPDQGGLRKQIKDEAIMKVYLA